MGISHTLGPGIISVQGPNSRSWLTPATSYNIQTLSLPTPNLINGSHQVRGNHLPKGCQGRVIIHAFPTAFNLPLPHTIILPCSTENTISIYALFSSLIHPSHPIHDLPLDHTSLSSDPIIFLTNQFFILSLYPNHLNTLLCLNR